MTPDENHGRGTDNPQEPADATPLVKDQAAPEHTDGTAAAPTGGEPTTGEVRDSRRTLGAAIFETVIILLIAVVVAVFIQSFFIKAFLIPSSSMSPTLQIGDRVMVEKVTYYFHKPRRGDIIVFRYPPREPAAMNTSNAFYWPFEMIGETLHLTHRGSTPFVKRVVATGGQTVALRNGQLYVNHKKVHEDYIVNDNADFGPVVVPKDSLFCMGDNRPNSRDSRAWGVVPVRSVIGKVFLIWWPLSRFGVPG